MNDQQSVLNAFREQFGRDPEVMIRACGRINLIGEHTDYNDGFVLPAAIDKHLYFAVGRNQEARFRLRALDIDAAFDSEGLQPAPTSELWVNYLLGIADQFIREGAVLEGVDCTFGGNLPIGAGVSSSAALEGGFAMALNTIFQMGWDKVALARLAQRSSHSFVGIPCGIMDQFASLMGQEHQVIQLDCRSLDYTYFPFETERYSLILLNSRVSHSLAESAYGERVKECRSGLDIIAQSFPEVASFRDVKPEMLEACRPQMGELIYRRCSYVIGEIQRVLEACRLLLADDFAALGQLMYATHDGLQNDYEVSCSEIDFLVAQAKARREVLGARIMGGGFGGCTINLVETSFRELFKSSMKIAYEREFGIELEAIPVNIVEGTSVIGYH